MGIDLGTSSVKTVITDMTGNILSSGHVNYDIEIPEYGYAEQNPETWWTSTKESIHKALNRGNIDPKNIVSIGFSGQMHGLVMLNKEDIPVYNAILHCDSRSAGETYNIRNILNSNNKTLYNPIFPGFQLPSLLWIRNNKPAIYEKITSIMSPKDYIQFRLTGEKGTEITDASATLLFDMDKGNWCEDVTDIFQINKNILLPVHKSYEPAGGITAAASSETGLKEGTTVVYGAGDQPAQATGNGVVSPGKTTCTIGTSGQIFSCTDSPIFNQNLNTHTFVHTPQNTWFIMGAMLSAGLSLKWLKNNILNTGSYSEMDLMADEIKPSVSNPVFQPYLCGERTPHMNPDASALFCGLRLNHDKRHMIRSVMEGVVFALRECLETIESVHNIPGTIIASGGGAQSRMWMQMQADILNREISATASSEQACLGACILAAVGYGEYKDIGEACYNMVHKGSLSAVPDKANVKIYDEIYSGYKQLYKRLK